jgi:hypothetical protein
MKRHLPDHYCPAATRFMALIRVRANGLAGARDKRFGCAATLACILVALGGCKKSAWVEGKWLHVDENGKPGMCHEFASKQKFSVYRSADCSGQPDPLLSGKWQLKAEKKLAVLRESEGEAGLALINEHDEKHFVARGALAGSFFRVGEAKPADLLADLRKQGSLKVFPLDSGIECTFLGRSFDQVSGLPKEEKPAMLRARDQGLIYHADTKTGDSKLEKVVFALNQEQIDWIAFHLAEAAFEPPGPAGRLEARLGPPVSTATTGAGEERQTIAMWNAYCSDLRGAFNKSVDITLFSTPGKRQGMYYVSEGVVADLWESLKATIANAPPAEEGDDDAEQGSAAAAAPAPEPTPAPSPAPAPEPAGATKSAPAPTKAPAAAAPSSANTAKKAKQAPGGRLAMPGDDDI